MQSMGQDELLRWVSDLDNLAHPVKPCCVVGVGGVVVVVVG